MEGTAKKPAKINSLEDHEMLIADPVAEPSSLRSRSPENPFENIASSAHSRVKQIWAIGGGKGGVGKSLIASSLAICLARTGNKVTAIDLDLGGANLHTTLGVDLPRKTLSDFFSSSSKNLDSCAVASGIPNLDLVSGAQDAIQITQMDTPERALLIEKLREMDTDYIVLDLGAGTSQSTIDFFLAADIGVLTMLPEPTSIENAYRFIKSVYYTRLRYSRHLKSVRHLIDAATDPNNTYGIRTPSDLFREINKHNPEAGMKLKQEIEKLHLRLFINQARTQTDIDLGFSIKTVCKKYFGIELDYVGYLDYDSAVWQAVRRKRPLLLEFPNSKLVAAVDRVAQYLLKRHSQERTDLY
jgi:flagellar biosynthesis protein FlhG